MSQKSEETQSTITQLVMGSRRDHVTAPDTQKYFSQPCAECGAETLTEIAYPKHTKVVCNVCMPTVAARLTQELDAQLAFDMPPDAKARALEAAKRHNMSLDEFLRRFVAWKTGKLMNAPLYNTQKQENEETES
jgi:recombinational DNA repair protein (RecF pathway)